MAEFVDRLWQGGVRAKRALILFCLIVYALLVKVSGGSLFGMFVFWLYLLGYLYLPGRLLWRLTGLKEPLGADMRLPGAVLLGTGFLCVLYCFCMRLGALPVLRVLPPLAASAELALFWRPRRTAARLRDRWHDGAALSWGALYAVLVLLYAFCVVVKNARPSAAGGILPNQDLLWNIGNANSFAIAFPPQDIRFSQVRLTYHYLTEMTEGILAIVSGLPAYDLIAFYAGPAVLAALLAGLFALGGSFYRGNRKKTAFFVFGLFLLGDASLFAALTNGRGLFWNYLLYYLVTNINAQATALLFTAIFLVLFFEMSRRRFDVSLRYLGVFFGSFVLLCFAKGPVAAILLCSFAVTMLFELCRRPRCGRALAALAGPLAIFALIYKTFYAAGVNTSMHLGTKTFEMSFFAPALSALWNRNIYVWYAALPVFAALILLCMAPLQFTLYLRGLGPDLRGILRLPAERLIVNGIAVGGAVAYFIFWHPSYSQIYFVLFALFAINLLAADRVGKPVRKTLRAVLAVFACVGLLTTAVLDVNFVGSGSRQLLRNLDVIARYPYPAVASPEDEDAMEWLRANTDTGITFATNRINTFPQGNEGVSCIYTALSGRQAYMEGTTYAITNMGVSEPVVRKKRNVNLMLFDAATSAEQVRELADENDIDYLVVSLQFPADTAHLAAFPLVYENAGVQIYRIRGGQSQ